MMSRLNLRLVIPLAIAIFLMTWLIMRSLENEKTVHHKSETELETPANPKPRDSAPVEELMEDGFENITPQQRRFLEAFNTPINFWGRVEDLSGNPVSGAQVIIHVNDKPWDLEGRSNSGRTLVSDSNGRFEIKGLRGSSIAVEVRKDGYAQIRREQLGVPSSIGRITYANPEGLLHNEIPTPTKPAVFVLRKQIEADILDVVTRKQYELPINGQPLRIGLGDDAFLEARCWASPEKRSGEGRNAPFDWRFEVSVEGGGGLTEWDDRTAVIAPDTGYRNTFGLEMPATLPEGEWSSSRRDLAFWAKLNDGTYARLELDVRVGRMNQLYVSSWRNPTGSKNLEHDPAKENKIHRDRLIPPKIRP